MNIIPNTPAFELPGVKLGEEIGRGSFGGVYQARHLTLDVDLAVKIIDTKAGDSAALERALSEARLMARLDHPNLLRIHDSGRLGSFIYLVLEFMDGSCSTISHAAADRVLDLTRQLLSGLQALHDARIIHRDIKPANCLIRERDNRVKLADLGIAVLQATSTGGGYDTAGTLPFMAPELFENPPRYSPVSDLYALGLTLVCMCLDEDPFPSGSLGEIMAWASSGDRPALSALRPDLPPDLAALISRMISPKLEDRPFSATDALALLGAITPVRTTASLPQQDEPATAIGPWLLGAQVYASDNWHAYVVTHARTGTAARLSHLQPKGPLANITPLILASAERASKLDHPQMLDVIDWGIEDGRAYVVTEPQGRTIHDLVKSSGPLEELDAVEFAVALADALAYLDEQGLVYQVLDPGAAVIASDARSAELSWPVYCIPAGTPAFDAEDKGQRVAVPLFAAPEAIMGRRGLIEPPVDVYGLGEVLYFMLAGRSAYSNSSSVSLALAKAQPAEDIRELAPTVTAPTATLIVKMMNPDSELRPSASDVRDQLARIARRLRGMGRHLIPTQKPITGKDKTMIR